MFICKNKSNIGKLYQVRRTMTFICKNKPKTPISGRLPGETAGNSALPTPKFRPIRRYLAPDLAVRSANGWRCSKNQSSSTVGLHCVAHKTFNTLDLAFPKNGKHLSKTIPVFVKHSAHGLYRPRCLRGYALLSCVEQSWAPTSQPR
jgi:hypothetical protein